jgi:fructose-1,6-bisphosphatase/sedoheptulose 1,7-bisphosphatase-like protein
MSREAALYLGEPVGTGFGSRIDILVDPLEVTNAAKPYNANKGDFQGGEGWSPEMVNPQNWFPGYSGALSLMAAVDASGHDEGFRLHTDDLYLNKMFLHWMMEYQGINLNSPSEKLVKAVIDLFGADPRAAALGRSRHRQIFEQWIAAGMKNEDIHKPTDGDSMLAFAIASGMIHFGGLTGGVMEGVIGGMAGVPFGLNMSFQFVSHSKLKETKADADLLNEEHRFGFNESERDQMILTRLYDSQHIGSTLRRLGPVNDLRAHIVNAAAAEIDIPGFSHSTFISELNLIEALRDNIRFSESSRAFLIKILERHGWMDVRKVAHLSDFRFSRDSMYFATAITPNKWSPLEGIRVRDGRLVLDSMFVGGNSQAVFILETEIRRV